MDPNKTLENLRDITQQSLGTVYVAGPHPPNAAKLEELLTDLAETVDNLDAHLTGGGLLPNAWSKPNGYNYFRHSAVQGLLEISNYPTPALAEQIVENIRNYIRSTP